MTKCSIIECGSRQKRYRTSLTFHRLPRGELKKKKWLEAIGAENIWLRSKDVFICSLHFHQDSFNRTLEVLRLRDDAVPTLHLQLKASQGSSVIPTENSPDATSSVVKDDARDPLAIETMITKFVPQPIHGTSVPAKMPHASKGSSVILTENSPDATLNVVKGETRDPANHWFQTQLVKKLEATYVGLRKKVKRLHEQTLKHKKCIAHLKDVINNLLEKNSSNNQS